MGGSGRTTVSARAGVEEDDRFLKDASRGALVAL